jgi:hypothetical protein
MESTSINGPPQQIDFSSIPADLQERNQWVLWKSVDRNGKVTKIPLSVYNTPASSTDSETWTSFDNAVGTYDESQHSGIGFVFTSDDQFCGIDLDGCRDPKTGFVADWAVNEVMRFNSYTEISPSQTGLKIWIKADSSLATGKRKELRVPEIVAKTPAIEIYTQGRYFAVTGQVYKHYRHVEHRESELQAFLKQHWPAVDAQQHDWRSDDAVVERARKYVAKIPGAVAGSSGHNATFHVACVLVKGFGLSQDQAFGVLSEWNATCNPVWTVHELRHKVESASKASGKVNYLRNVDPERWESIEVPKHKPAEPSESVVVRSFAGIDASELASYATQEPDWLVEGILTIDEPVLVGARSKGCKTLQLTDLAVALASGTSWMGVFKVPKRRKVLFITGEANYRRIAKHIEKACKARGIEFADLKGFLRVEAIEFPCLPSAKDQAAIRADVQQHGFEVVIVDPLYRGLTGVDSARLSEMGSAIKAFQAACAPACMILSHHVVKSAAREYGEPPALEDMTGAGIAESCGQWWLVGRNEKYAWDWKHDLCVQFGGREGQGGGRRILFNERDWTFQVDAWHEYTEQAREELVQQRHEARLEAEDRKRNAARTLILKAVRNVKTPQSKNQIRESCGAVQADFRIVFAEMVRELTLVQRPYRDALNRLQAAGYLLKDYADEFDKQAAAAEKQITEDTTDAAEVTQEDMMVDGG